MARVRMQMAALMLALMAGRAAGQPMPPPTPEIHPATRADWLGECDRRLQSLNRNVDSGIGYQSTCRAWLDYYERIGVAANGYDFVYAIPVQRVTETRIIEFVADPCDCARPVRRHGTGGQRWKRPVRDKRAAM
ncbi:MAG: hypothetical protein KGM17_13990 [Sphingomonadales bacterium]|nr:hypothetical protein [Sphingomonadales bacterium]